MLRRRDSRNSSARSTALRTFIAGCTAIREVSRCSHQLLLNHPNIATIHGLEESDGIRALVMELVEVPTLTERIGHRAMPLDEALPIAKQIAEGLEYAHENQW